MLQQLRLEGVKKIGDCHKRRPRKARRINDIFSRG